MPDKKYPWEEVWKKGKYSSPETRENKAKRKLNYLKEKNLLERNLHNVLEIGCGSCDFISQAAEQGIKITSYLGIDKSKTAIKKAAKKSSPKIKNFINDDLVDIRLNEKFETIITLGCIEHIKEEQKAINFIFHHSKPGTKVYLTTSNTKSVMHLARLIRERTGFWPYGYQKNHSPHDIESSFSDHFRIGHVGILHGDNDFPLSTLADKIISKILNNWGRYLVVVMTKEEK